MRSVASVLFQSLFKKMIFQIPFELQSPEYDVTDRPSLAQHNKAIIFNITSFPKKHNKKISFPAHVRVIFQVKINKFLDYI